MGHNSASGNRCRRARAQPAPLRIDDVDPNMRIRPVTLLGVAVAGWLIAVTTMFAGSAQQAPAGAPPAAAMTDSRALYEAKCANCHGREGKGDGPAAGLLVVKPRDFTSGKYKV